MAQVYGFGPEFRGASINRSANGDLLEIPGGIGPHTVPDYVVDSGLLSTLDSDYAADPLTTTSLWTSSSDVALASLSASDKRVQWSANQYAAPDFSTGWTSNYTVQPLTFAYSNLSSGLPAWMTVARRCVITATGNVAINGAAQFQRGALTGSGASIYGLSPATTHTHLGCWVRLASKSGGVGDISIYLQQDYNTDSTYRNSTLVSAVATLPNSGEWIYVQTPLTWAPHALANNVTPIVGLNTLSALVNGDTFTIDIALPVFRYWQGVSTRDLGSGTCNVTNPRAATNTTGWGTAGLTSPTLTSQSITNHPGGATTTLRVQGTANATTFWASGQGSAGANTSISGLVAAGKRRVSPGDVLYYRAWVRRNEADASIVAASIQAYSWKPDGTWLADTTALNPVTLNLGQWTLLSGSYTVPANTGWISFSTRFNVTSGAAVDASVTQFQESNAPIADYWDGDTPGAGWLGTAHASKSVWKGTSAEWTVTNTASTGVNDARNVWTANVLPDPNFAGSLAGWSNYGVNMTHSLASITNDGANGATTCVQHTGTWTSTGIVGQVIEPAMADAKGSTLLIGYTHYRVSWWMKIVSVTGGTLTLDATNELVVMDDNNAYLGAVIGTYTGISTADGWKQYTTTFTGSTVASTYPSGRRVAPRVRYRVAEAAPVGASVVCRVGGLSMIAWDGVLVTPDVPTVAAMDDAANGNFIIETDSGYTHMFGSNQKTALGPTRITSAAMPYIAPGTTKMRLRKLAPNVGTSFKAWRLLP